MAASIAHRINSKSLADRVTGGCGLTEYKKKKKYRSKRRREMDGENRRKRRDVELKQAIEAVLQVTFLYFSVYLLQLLYVRSLVQYYAEHYILEAFFLCGG